MDALADPRQLTDRFLDEWLGALPKASLEALAGFRFSDELQDAMDAFAERAGLLNPGRTSPNVTVATPPSNNAAAGAAEPAGAA